MNFKRVAQRLFSIVLILAICLSAVALAAEPKPFTLRVGYWPDYGVTADEKGSLSGYTYDYMMKIAQINHWNLEFIPCDWAEGLKLLQDGKLDLFGPLEKTAEREQQYDFPNQSMGEEYGAIYARENNDEIFYGDAQSLDGKKLGSMGDNYYKEELSAYCEKNQIEVSVVTFSDMREMNQALLNGKIDLLLAGNMQPLNGTKMVLRLSREAFYYPTTKGNRFVLDAMNEALNTLQVENAYFNVRLYEKHYARFASEKEAFTRAETEFIHRSPLLSVGYEESGKPMECYDAKSNSADGISIDLLREISKYSGLYFKFVKTESLEQSQQMVENGELQLVSGLIGSNEFTELYHLEPTNALAENDLAFILRKGADFKEVNPILAIPDKWVGIRHHMEKNYPEIKMEYYSNIQECLNAVCNGRATMTVLSTYATEDTLRDYRYQKLCANSMSKGHLSICLGTPLDADPVLRSIINKSIAAINSETRKQIIYQHTIGRPYQLSIQETLRYNIPILLAVIMAFLLVLYLFSIRARKELNKLAFIDPLTGEMNLNKFKIEAQKLVLHKEKKYALMIVDIDKFKSINDLYGYTVGDRMLIIMAKALRNSLFPDMLLCHGTADRFDLFFEYTDENWIKEFFDRITKAAIDAVAMDMPSCNIVINGGVCVVQPEDNNIVSLIDRANIARKQVKNFRESGLVFYTKSMYDRINQMRRIENNMAASLKNEEFVVYLQPKIDLTTRRIAGAEALVRWQHPERGLIPPSEFIPLFEENGFIVNLDFYVLERVCELLERWKHEGRKLFTISVNLSRRHLFHADTARVLHGIVSRYDVKPNFIEVELTESAFNNCDIPAINRFFDELHECGFSVSVDDFGAGYSSLSLLKDLSIDVLKIDKSFFDCYQSCKTDKMGILLESVISLSRRLNIRTVSEGVETEQQVQLLEALGCDLVQGFYFARPMPIKQLEQRLETGDLF